MSVLDKNKKELGIGDEVVMHFRVTAVFPQEDERKGLVNLESMNNRRGVPPNPAETFEDLPPVVLSSEHASRVILQRKAKPPV